MINYSSIRVLVESGTLKIYDKASWHIDNGEDPTEVIAKFTAVFNFLKKNKLLSKEGEEILAAGIDDSVSLNQNMVNPKGAVFLNANYDKVINASANTIERKLNARYKSKH